jgi:hypothetical protein
MICETCHGEIRVGDWPYCHGDPSAHTPPSLVVVDDTIDFWQQNFGPEPEHFTSKQKMAKRAEQLGLRPFVRHIGKPGSDRSDKTQRFI